MTTTKKSNKNTGISNGIEVGSTSVGGIIDAGVNLTEDITYKGEEEEDYGAANYVKDIGKYTSMGAATGNPYVAGAAAIIGTGVAISKDIKQKRAEKTAKKRRKSNIVNNFAIQNMAEGGEVGDNKDLKIDYRDIRKGESIDDYLDRVIGEEGKENDPYYMENISDDLYEVDEGETKRLPKKYLMLNKRRKAERELIGQMTDSLGPSLYGDEKKYKEIKNKRNQLISENKKDEFSEFQSSLEPEELTYEDVSDNLGSEYADKYYELIKRDAIRHDKAFPESPNPIFGDNEIQNIKERNITGSEYIDDKDLKIGKRVSTTLSNYIPSGEYDPETAFKKENELRDTQSEKVDITENKAEGGEIKGKGTSTSDSIDADLDKNDIIIPADGGNLKKKEVEQMMKDIGLDGSADIDSGTEDVNVSDGEWLVPKEYRSAAESWLKKKGKTLNDLAPDAKEPISDGGQYKEGTVPLKNEDLDYDWSEENAERIVNELTSFGSNIGNNNQNNEPLPGLGGATYGSNEYGTESDDDNNNNNEEDDNFFEDNLGYLLGGVKGIAGLAMSNRNKKPSGYVNTSAEQEIGAVDDYYNKLIGEVSKGMTPFEKAEIDKDLQSIYGNTIRSIEEASGGDNTRAANLSILAASDIADKYSSLAAAESKDRRNKIAAAIGKEAATKSRMKGAEYSTRVSSQERKNQREYKDYLNKRNTSAQLIAGAGQDVIGQQQYNLTKKRLENMPKTSIIDMILQQEQKGKS